MEKVRRTKIIATIGPASESEEILEKMIVAGVDIVRLNFSHGTPEEHSARAERVRSIARKLQKQVYILADLQGPKIRIARFEKNKKVLLVKGQRYTIDVAFDSTAGNDQCVGCCYEQLPNEVVPGDILLINDGLVEFKVLDVIGTAIRCEVLEDCVLSNNKGINKKGGGLSAPALTQKDKEDLKTAVMIKADFLAVSFPRSKEDIIEARQLLAQAHNTMGIIAKIERAEAIISGVIEDIINVSDAIMVARGDLGVEIGYEVLPAEQKRLIWKANELHTPVITATQMMESMIENSIPTRAEVSDIANAIWDGTDAVMLSAETASGKFPVQAVRAMAKICIEAEKHEF